MAESYLRRNDVGYPTRPNPRGIYAIKTFDNEVLADLQDEVNMYLLNLPGATNSWSPHIVSVQYSNYPSVSGPPTLIHVCVITIFAAGTVTATPTG